MINELMRWDFGLPFMRYGPQWKKHRKFFHEYFHSNAVPTHRPIQLKDARAFLRRLLDTPDQFLHHIRHTFAATIMKIAYGIQVLDSDDPYIPTAEEAFEGVAEAGVPGSFLVDLIPVLKYIPSWVPGAGFKRKAARWAEVNSQLINRPFNAVKDALSQGTAVPSALSRMLERIPDDESRAAAEITPQNCAGIAYAGGADTTVSSIRSFFLAMATHPAAQKKAQAEFDAVVSQSRLPDFDDFDSLPYIQAMAKETIRWQNVLPLGAAQSLCVMGPYGSTQMLCITRGYAL